MCISSSTKFNEAKALKSAHSILQLGEVRAPPEFYKKAACVLLPLVLCGKFKF